MKKPAKASPMKAKAVATPAKRPVNTTALPAQEKKHAEPAPSGKDQRQAFEKATALFRRQDFGQARALFHEASRGPAVEVAHSAQMYVRMCDRRLAAGKVNLQSPEDHYNYGITLMNQRRMEEAEEHLRQAVKGNDRAGHFHYALALCCGLRGNLPDAAGHLKRAIEIEPGNRVAALNDVEFQSFAARPPVREVLVAGRSNPG